jgi:hypothetical protein
MSEVATVLLAAIGLGNAIIGYLTLREGRQRRVELAEYHKEVNGMKTQLVAAVKGEALGVGRAEGKAEQKAEAALEAKAMLEAKGGL